MTTKLFIPPAPHSLIARPRLSQKLDSLLLANAKIALIAAPPGFGKTTIVAEWIHRKEKPPQPPAPLFYAGWLSLDAADNDATRFWSHVIGSLQTIDPGVGKTALASLLSPTPPSAEAILTSLVNELAAVPHLLLFVLDDYHVIENLEIHDGLAFLIDSLPPNVRLVLTSRTDPPLPLEQLRAHGQIVELYADDLRFTGEEAVAFLQETMQLSLPAQDAAALTQHTEGWIAGLQLAALSMRGRTDRQGLYLTPATNNRYVLEYLTEEVLERQSPGVKSFLLTTSILDRMNGELANALTGLADGQSQLHELEQSNLFVVGLDADRQWYRYHHLFAEMLRGRLRATDAARIPELHAAASAWFEQHDSHTEAITHALTGNLFDRAAHLIAQHALSMVLHGQWATIHHWLEQLPRTAWTAEPRLELIQGWIYVITTENSSIEPGLVRVEQILGNKPQLDSPALRGEIAAQRAIAKSFLVAPDALPAVGLALQIAPDSPFIRGPLMIAYANALYAAGKLNEAYEVLLRLRPHVESAGTLSLRTGLRVVLIRTLLGQGRLREAQQTAREAQQLVEEHQASSAAGAAMIYAQQGVLAFQFNQLEQADEYLDTSIEIARATRGYGNELFALAQRAFVAQARGEFGRALNDMNRAIAIAKEYQPTATTLNSFHGRLAELELRQGNLAIAGAWMAEHPIDMQTRPPVSPYDHDRFARARLHMARAEWEQALVLLEELERAASATGHGAFALTAMLLAALAEAGKGNHSESLQRLERALVYAEPEGYVRAFLDEGGALRELLRDLAVREKSEKRARSQYLGSLLEAFASPEKSSGLPVRPMPAQVMLVEPLSERELEVLGLLNQGFANREIAGKLFVAVGTVKKHLNNAYGKLGVQTRTEALARARELQLL